jgi:DNA modification methylase
MTQRAAIRNKTTLHGTGTRATESPYLLVRADATRIPLRENSADLIIATPPHFGERRFSKSELCSSRPQEYKQMFERFLAEAVRVLKPYRYILLYTSSSKERNPKIFQVMQKRSRNRRWRPVLVKRESFRAHYAAVRNFYWEALPIRLYHDLIHRYSQPGDKVLHVFAGSGNGGIAALELGRWPVLIDLYYQKQARKRLNDWLASR